MGRPRIQVLAEKEGAAEDGEQSTVNPNEVRSLLLTPAEEDLIDEGTRTRSSSPPSSRSDFGPLSALRPFDDADPRELAGKGWDSDADWGFGGFEPLQASVPPALEQMSQSSALVSQIELEDAEVDAAGASALCGRGQAPLGATLTCSWGRVSLAHVEARHYCRLDRQHS